jgi:hypothetical protein
MRVLRPRPDWLPRASVGLGIAATIAMNVAAGSRGDVGGAMLGVLPPVGFVVSLETLILLVRRLARLPGGWAWCLGAGIPLAGLAAFTGIISYLHALTVAIWTASPGEAGQALTEHLLPLVADLMIVTGSVALVALAVAAKPVKAAPVREPVKAAPRQRVKTAPPEREPSVIVSEAELVRQLLAQGSHFELPSERALAKDKLGGDRRRAKRVLTAVRAGSSGHGVNGHG